MDRLFDATGVKSAFRFPGRMQRDVTPPFQDFMRLEAGPLWPDDEDRKQVDETLAKISKLMMGVLHGSDFATASHEFYLELFAGTSALLVEENGDGFSDCEFTCVPMQELDLELDAKGKTVSGVYWSRKWTLEDVQENWPRGHFSSAIREKMREAPETEVTIVQYTYYDRHAKNYRLLVWIAEDTEQIDANGKAQGRDPKFFHTEIFRTNPWIITRFMVVPGETWGRGPAMMALAFLKTLNKAQELALIAGGYAVKPAWMAHDDSGLNPDTARMAPGKIIKVKRTGGPRGASLERLPIPADFDISTFVIKDQREQAREALFDSALPDPTGAVRSPTEIVNRIQTLVEDLNGAYGRLVREFLTPLARRVLDILEKNGRLKGFQIDINDLLFRVRVTSPIAEAQGADKVKIIVHWLELVLALAGPEGVRIMARIDDILPEIGRILGVEERFIASKSEQEEMRQKIAQEQQQAAAAEAQAKASAQQPAPTGEQMITEQMGVPLQ